MRLVGQQPAGRVRLDARGQPDRPGTATSSSNTPAVVAPSFRGSGDASLRDQLAAGQARLLHGYAGGVYVVIDFTNTSGSTCTLFGYPGVSLVTGPPYTQIGLAAKRSTSTPKKLVTLAAGATANAQLQIVDALNYPSATCGPTKATALKIYPPNQTEPVYLPNTSSGCTKPVQIMYIGAVRPAPAAPPDPSQLGPPLRPAVIQAGWGGGVAGAAAVA